jgi:hypothetical protein
MKKYSEKDLLKRIYPSLVTYAADWRQRLREVRALKLKEIALFLTGIEPAERKKLYAGLEQTAVRKIPHIHLRHNVSEEEIEYLVKRYGTRAFTIHYDSADHFLKSKYRRMFFVENNWREFGIKKFPMIKNFGGICIDLSHLLIIHETEPGNHRSTIKAIKKYRIGCNHVSDIRPDHSSHHYVSKKTDLDYLKFFPRNYFSRYICLEMGNPIRQQLELKKYAAKMLAKAWNSSNLKTKAQ